MKKLTLAAQVLTAVLVGGTLLAGCGQEEPEVTEGPAGPAEGPAPVMPPRPDAAAKAASPAEGRP